MDNASINTKLYDNLIADFAHFIRLPCAAHIIQLCVHRILLIPELKDVVDFMELILSSFRANSFPYSRLQKVQMDEDDLNEEDANNPVSESNGDNDAACSTRKPKALSLRRPNDTRWSSSLMAAERILRLKPHIIKVANRYCRKIIEEDEKNNLWNKLDALALMLEPFRKATDILQSDSSNLYTVYLEFTKMLLAVRKFPTDTLKVDVKAIKNIIVTYWKKHVNINAVIMSAKLSFDNCYEDVFDNEDENAITKAKGWFMEFGVNYISYYMKPSDTRTKDEIYLRLMKQYGDLLLMAPPFSKYKKYINNIQEDIMARENESRVDAMQLWGFVGDEVPELAQCAVALLTLPASEAAVERSFSQQGVVHRPVRNRLSSKQIECEMRVKFNSKRNAQKEVKQNLFHTESLDIDAITDYNETGGRLFELDEEITDELARIDAEETEVVQTKECPNSSTKRRQKDQLSSSSSSTCILPTKDSSSSSGAEEASSSHPPKRPKITKVSKRSEVLIPYGEIKNLNDFVEAYVREKQLTSTPHWTASTNAHLDFALASWPKQIKDCTEEVRKRIAAYVKERQQQVESIVATSSHQENDSTIQYMDETLLPKEMSIDNTA